MPRSGALTLDDFHPDELVRLACPKCGRAGQLRVSTLVERFGRDITLPDLLKRLADCPRANSMNDPCGAIYPDLLARHRGAR